MQKKIFVISVIIIFVILFFIITKTEPLKILFGASNSDPYRFYARGTPKIVFGSPEKFSINTLNKQGIVFIKNFQDQSITKTPIMIYHYGNDSLFGFAFTLVGTSNSNANPDVVSLLTSGWWGQGSENKSFTNNKQYYNYINPFIYNDKQVILSKKGSNAYQIAQMLNRELTRCPDWFHSEWNDGYLEAKEKYKNAFSNKRLLPSSGFGNILNSNEKKTIENIEKEVKNSRRELSKKIDLPLYYDIQSMSPKAKISVDMVCPSWATDRINYSQLFEEEPPEGYKWGCVIGFLPSRGRTWLEN